MSRQGPSPRFRFVFAAVLLASLAFLVPALREGDPLVYMLAAGTTAVMLLSLMFLPRLFSLDRFIFTLAVCLGVLPVIVLTHIGPEEGFSQALKWLAGGALLLVGASVGRLLSASMLTGLSASFLGVLLAACGLVGDTLNLSLAEASIPLLLIGCTAILSARGGFAAMIPCAAGAVLLILQSRPLLAAIWVVVFGVLLWASGSKAVWGVPVLLALLYLVLRFVPPVVPSSLPDGSSSSASLSALVSSGLWGTDAAAVHRGGPDPSSLLYPASDCFGLVFTGLALLLWLPLTLRGMFVASVARSRFHAFLAMGCSLFPSLRLLTALLAAFSVVPLPLTAPPLLTSDLPDLCAQCFTLGIICGISGRNEADLAEDAHLAMLSK